MATAKKGMTFDRKKLSDKKLLELYQALLLPRMIEEKMLLLLRQGKVSKWFAGIGQEAIAVGATLAMQEEEYIFPMHRNIGVFTSREVPLDKLFMQLQGKAGGYSKGRERSFHFGISEKNIVGMISHLAAQLSLADGVGLAHLLAKEANCTLAFTGEGGTSEGEFHEALNVAAVWDLPVIFLIENNGYGLSTPVFEQYRAKQLSDKGIGYGMESVKIDGNNILEVYDTISSIAQKMRKNPKPVLVECMTFRMRGHEEASGVKYVPKELFTEWEKKDPLQNYQDYLENEGLLDQKKIDQFKDQFQQQIDAGLESAFAAPEPVADTLEEFADLFANGVEIPDVEPGNDVQELRVVDAISDGLREAMQKHDNLVLMGQDIAEYGGVFKITEGFIEEFGKDRVRNTPICESAIIGSGLGLSLKGFKSVIEMQFADFVTCGFNQIVNNLAKIHYRWGENADVVVRMPTGAGVGAGPFHSQSNEAWFFHTPGLKVVYPATPSDAKGLLLSAIADPNPVMFFEHKYLYRSLSEEVPTGYFNVPIGKARLAAEGDDISIITYGMGVHWALEAAQQLSISADVLDLRTLSPLDLEAIESTVNKTGKALILHEDTLVGGIGGELAAHISQHCFESLDAPVMRVASLDTPIPFAKELEENFLPKQRLIEKLNELLAY
jgi:2-oxoisovalerate dehydrogenase E1 component